MLVDNFGEKLEIDPSFNREHVVDDQFNENAFYSIDGERYPAQDVTAKVLHRKIRFFY